MLNKSQQAVDTAVMQLVLSVLDKYGLHPAQLTNEQLRILITFKIKKCPYQAFVYI